MQLTNTNNTATFTVGVCKDNQMPNYVQKDEATKNSIVIDGKAVDVFAKPNATETDFYCFKLNGKALYVKGNGILTAGPLTVVERAPRTKKVATEAAPPAAPQRPTREELKALKGSDLEARTGLKLNGKSKDNLIDRYFASLD